MGDWYNRDMPCEFCGSTDAKQESEHHWKCFSCSKVTLKRNKKGGNGTQEIKKERKPMRKQPLIEPGEYYELKPRGITEQIARKCGITMRQWTGSFNIKDERIYVTDEWVYVFNKYHDGKVVSQKIRHRDDKKLFRQFGDTDDKTFYGQHLCQPHPDKFCVITGGEFDQAIVTQEVNVSAVSVTNGEGGLLNQIRANHEWCNQWKYLAIGMDNDKAGQEAVTKLLESGIMEPGKIRVITWTMKDANAMHLAGMTAELKRNVWNAAEYRPNDLIRPSERRKEILKKPKPGPDTPYATMTKALQGYMDNRVTVVIGPDGIGKSKLVDEMITDLVYYKKVKVWSYSSEQDANEQLVRQASNKENIPFYIPGTDWHKEKILQAIDDLEDRLIIWEPEGPVTIDSIFAKMKYAAIADGCKVFFVDHLKGIDSQLQDVHNQMGKFLCDIKQFAKNQKVHIVLISHVAKNKKQARAGEEDESWNRGRIPTKEDAYGSSAITAWADNIIALSRNVESEDEYEQRILHVHYLKTRLMGVRAPKKSVLKYNIDTNRLVEEDYSEYINWRDGNDDENNPLLDGLPDNTVLLQHDNTTSGTNISKSGEEKQN